jgi:DNA repair exonuclease SbcCD nuclease subunit
METDMKSSDESSQGDSSCTEDEIIITMDGDVTFCLLGDIHFQNKNLSEAKIFTERVIELIKKHTPTYVILMGDQLHTNSNIHVQPHNAVYELIKQIWEITNVYILIGNHDMINHTQYRTDMHIFNPFKQWKQKPHTITVVDDIMELKLEDKLFVFCPYVPKGRFMELLNDGESEKKIKWKNADAIFCHQDFYGCVSNKYASNDGDKWEPDYPIIFSGHIHEMQKLGTNVYYTGSSMQHDFGDTSDKRVWIIVFGDETKIKKYNLGLRTRRTIELKIEDIENEYKNIIKQHELYEMRIILSGTSEQFSTFRKNKIYTSLINEKIKISFLPIKENILESSGVTEHKTTSFKEIIENIICKSTKGIQTEYDLLKKNMNQ